MTLEEAWNATCHHYMVVQVQITTPDREKAAWEPHGPHVLWRVELSTSDGGYGGGTHKTGAPTLEAALADAVAKFHESIESLYGPCKTR